MSVSNKPGCHGIAIVHGSNETCQQCPVIDSCRQLAFETLTEINEHMDVSDLLVHYKDLGTVEATTDQELERARKPVSAKFAVGADEERMIQQLPKKAAGYARSLYQKGIDLRATLLSGRNPIENQKPQFLFEACRMLLEGGFTKQSLKAEFRRCFPSWGERTVEGQASVAFSLLWGIGAMELSSGRYVRRRIENEGEGLAS